MRSVLHGGLTPPALVADTTSVRRKNDDFCDEQTHVHKSGGRQPAVASKTRWSCESTRNESRRARGASARRGFPNRICKCNATNFRVWISRAECTPRGNLRPPLLVARCQFAGENDSRSTHRISLRKTTFAVHKRTFKRAAGVSPPWELLTPVQ
jgi:hypothetical protein